MRAWMSDRLHAGADFDRYGDAGPVLGMPQGANRALGASARTGNTAFEEYMVNGAGLEPAATGLKVRCSTC